MYAPKAFWILLVNISKRIRRESTSRFKFPLSPSTQTKKEHKNHRPSTPGFWYPSSRPWKHTISNGWFQLQAFGIDCTRIHGMNGWFFPWKNHEVNRPYTWIIVWDLHPPLQNKKAGTYPSKKTAFFLSTCCFLFFVGVFFKVPVVCWGSLITSWWFQPNRKILVELDHFPSFSGEI